MLPIGLTFVRTAIAAALHKDIGSAAHQFAAARWGSGSAVASVLKSAVAAGTTGAGGTWSELYDARAAALEFIELATPMTIIGKLPGIRYVPAGTPGVAMTDGATAFWVGEGQAVPLSRAIFDRSVMAALKVAALTVFSDEALKSPEAEGVIRRDLLRATVTATDAAFIDAANSGTAGKMPASVTSSAVDVSTAGSSGDVADDLGTAIENFEGDLLTAAWVLHPKLAAKIGLLAGGRGAGADVGALGGTLAGLPAITSNASPIDQIALIDGGGIVMVDDGAEIRTASHAMVEMDTAPTGEGFSPTAASATAVSLFQADLHGLLVIRRINWKVMRPGSVTIVTAADYTAS